eukprot:gnl/TRDRNA2_/TRDRNA2_122877_c1_seq1.p1 gnl/TRDRNA2_/TRDRNA2_122877_c1~~gnl/TRDRNA2_/TRDRNA2_122877_c1_seq1.p1  ORF type:complete len:240 (+),score=18.63 gnl/TRDRNA2_/TRDRNA2_122877_c1_seq1:98-721(+)
MVGDLSKLPHGMCICMFAFMWHTQAVSIARELDRPTPARVVGVSLGASFLVALFYSLVTFGGYASFGAAVKSEIMSSYPNDSIIFICLRVLLTLSVLIACPLNWMPVRESLIEVVRKVRSGFGQRRITRKVIGVTEALLAMLVAIVCPDAVNILQFLGGAIETTLMITMPTFMWAFVFHRSQPQFGIILGLCAIFSAVLFLASVNIL